MNRFSNRLSTILSECCAVTLLAALLVVLLPLLAAVAFTLRPLLLLAALVGIVIVLASTFGPGARTRTSRAGSARHGGA